MTELVVIAVINASVTLAGSALAYLGLRQRVDKTEAMVGTKLDVAATKVEETKQANLVQIEISNNFNAKIEKLHQGQNFLIREVANLKSDVKTLSSQTGIPLD